MRPTWYGETMIRHARAALNSLNQANDEVQAAKNGQFGQVNLGAITSPGVVLLPMTIAAIKEEHPNLRITIQIESSNVLVDQLYKGTLDVVLGRLSEEHDTADLRYEAIANESVCAVARPGHPLFSKSKLSIAELLDFCWIVPPVGSVMRHKFDLMFQEQDLPQLTNRVETSSLLFLTKMMEQSDMVSIMAADVARYYESHGMLRILPLDLPCEMEPFGFITRRDKPLSPAAQVLLNALKASVRTLY
jgi:DNA-binding transcriptional LysR family regulator